MSIFIGKDHANNSCCIVSKNKTTDSIRFTNPTISNNFAIDTRRDLLFCEIYDTLTFSLQRTYSKRGLTYNVYRLTVNNIITSIYTKRFILFINNYYTRINYVLPLESSMSLGGANAYYYGTTFIDIHTLDIVNKCNLITFYHTVEGLNIFNKYNNSNSIELGNSKFIVNGINYFKEKFIVTPAINSIDPIFNFGGIQFQVINGVESSGYTFSILSNNNIKVLSGTKLLFDSTASYLQTFLTSSSNIVVNFTIPSGYSEYNNEICTLPSNCKVLGITYYPRVSTYPSMKAHGLITNSTTSEEGIFLDQFPVLGPTGDILDGFISTSFYIVNNKLYIHRIAEYDGEPQGVYPNIDMRIEYFILSE